MKPARARARGMRGLFLEAEKDGFPGKHWEYAEETDGDHGRPEVRRVWACEDIDWFQDRSLWAELKTVIFRRRDTREGINGTTSEELHWVLDMAFDEDRSRARQNNSPINLAAIRRTALSLLQKNPSRKVGVASKRRLAPWDRDSLVPTLLGQQDPNTRPSPSHDHDHRSLRDAATEAAPGSSGSRRAPVAPAPRAVGV